jgi:hypothetical protein
MLRTAFQSHQTVGKTSWQCTRPTIEYATLTQHVLYRETLRFVLNEHPVATRWGAVFPPCAIKSFDEHHTSTVLP